MLDAAGGYASNVHGVDIQASLVPVDGDSSATQVSSVPGSCRFGETGSRLVCDPWSGIDTLIVTRLDQALHSLPGYGEDLGGQYWNSSALAADWPLVTGHLELEPSEDLNQGDGLNPGNLVLPMRGTTSISVWAEGGSGLLCAPDSERCTVLQPAASAQPALGRAAMGPQLTGLDPGNDAIEVSLRVTATISFNQAMTPGHGSFSIHDRADGSLVESVSADNLVFDGMSVRLEPSNDQQQRTTSTSWSARFVLLLGPALFLLYLLLTDLRRNSLM